MLLTSKAADSIAMGDLCEKAIRSQNAWSLLPTEAIFASVIPGEYMSGHVAGQIEFPKWLGMYSRQNKFDRILQELQVSSLNFSTGTIFRYLLTLHGRSMMLILVA